MPRLLIIRLVLMVFKGILPGLQKAAAESPNPMDDQLIQMITELISLFDSGELSQLMKDL